MAVKKGDNVKVDYTGTFDDGTVFDSSQHGDHSHPLEFEAGSGMVIKGFDDAILGMKVGEEKTIHIDPQDAYGDYDPKLVQKIPRSELPEGDLKAGMTLGMQTPDGHQIPILIKSINEKEATLDMNHPLAGKALNFKLKLVEIVSE